MLLDRILGDANDVFGDANDLFDEQGEAIGVKYKDGDDDERDEACCYLPGTPNKSNLNLSSAFL